MLRYWPLLAIFVVLATVVGMSQYAETSKQHYEQSTKQAKATAVAKGSDKETASDAQDTYKPPIWAKYVTFPEGVGAWAIILTLFAITWQSIATERAAEVGRAAAEAANAQIAMMKQKERARIKVEVCSIAPTDKGSIWGDFQEVKFQVLIFGFTDAFITDATAKAILEDREITESEVFGDKIEIPSVLKRERAIDEQSISIDPFLNYDKIADAVRGGTKFLNFSGHILYKDVFDDQHETVFCWTWRLRYDKVIKVWCGEWEKAGGDSQNYET